jgi:hypothetical protein
MAKLDVKVLTDGFMAVILTYTYYGLNADFKVMVALYLDCLIIK